MHSRRTELWKWEPDVRRCEAGLKTELRRSIDGLTLEYELSSCCAGWRATVRTYVVSFFEYVGEVSDDVVEEIIDLGNLGPDTQGPDSDGPPEHSFGLLSAPGVALVSTHSSRDFPPTSADLVDDMRLLRITVLRRSGPAETTTRLKPPTDDRAPQPFSIHPATAAQQRQP